MKQNPSGISVGDEASMISSQLQGIRTGEEGEVMRGCVVNGSIAFRLMDHQPQDPRQKPLHPHVVLKESQTLCFLTAV